MPKSRNLLANLPFAPIVGGMFAGVAAILVGATPYWLFVRAIAATGVPSVVPAANPPLGDTARLVAMAVAALLAGLAAYVVALAIERAMRLSPHAKAHSAGIEPVTTRDVSGVHNLLHRRPLLADSELGAPLMSVEAFEHARDELILDAPIADGDEMMLEPQLANAVRSDVNDVISTETVTVLPVAPSDLEPVPFPAPKTVAVDTLPIEALMARLEAAIAARPHGMPPLRNLGAFRVAR